MSKICNKCHIEKEDSEYYKNRVRCKKCVQAEQLVYKHKNALPKKVIVKHTEFDYFFKSKMGDFPANKYEIEQLMPLFNQERYII